MRQWNRQIFRFFLVLALGAGIGGLAGQAARPEKPKMRAELPAPVIMATVMEITAPDHCLLSPREEDDSAPAAGAIKAKADDERNHDQRAKKKIVACG